MTVSLTICTTCSSGAGARLAAEIEALARNRKTAPRIVRHECLWACSHGCVALIQCPGKTGYLAGGLVAGPAAASALFEWARVYAASIDGDVPYAAWPEGMKGRFIARIPEREGDSR